MSDIIEVNNLNVRYQQTIALENISVNIPTNVRACIIGPNGAGKSTFMKAIMGLIPFRAEKIKVFGDSLTNVRERVAYVPQTSEVNWNFPTTVKDVVLMGNTSKRLPFQKINKDQQRKTDQAIEKMQLTSLKDRQINQLSGGQKQRVFIARAIAQNADLYLFDEPLAGVDINSEAIIMTQLKEFQQQGKTSVTIHHDLATVPEYFDFIIMINKDFVISGPVESTFTQENIHRTYSEPTDAANNKEASNTNLIEGSDYNVN